jgi:pimeloyl-ACP methyl ester carboxylesterase
MSKRRGVIAERARLREAVTLRSSWLFAAALALWGVVGTVVEAQQPGTSPTVRMVNVDGRSVRVQFSGLDGRQPGGPVLVFEAGATNSLEVWRSVLPQLATVAPIVAYDRAGLGRSEWDNETPTPRHVSNRLRRLLGEIGADPPYVLVGYSWGGTLARYFAGYYPTEVAGLVYVDPGPIVTQSMAENVAPFNAIGAGRAEYEAFWSAYAALLERASPAARAEFNVYRGLMDRDLADRDLRPAPDVPVVVIVAAKPYPPLPGLPFDQRAHFQADLRHRIRMLQEWALPASRGTLVVSNHTSHAVTREDPDLIVWAVKRVLAAVQKRP